MSSSVSSMLDIAPTVSSSLRTSFKVPSSMIRFAKMPCSRLIVCSGWRRSWLAAARNRDLPMLACSASALADSNSSPTFFDSVMSSIATRIFRRASRLLMDDASAHNKHPPP